MAGECGPEWLIGRGWPRLAEAGRGWPGLAEAGRGWPRPEPPWHHPRRRPEQDPAQVGPLEQQGEAAAGDRREQAGALVDESDDIKMAEGEGVHASASSLGTSGR